MSIEITIQITEVEFNTKEGVGTVTKTRTSHSKTLDINGLHEILREASNSKTNKTPVEIHITNPNTGYKIPITSKEIQDILQIETEKDLNDYMDKWEYDKAKRIEETYGKNK